MKICKYELLSIHGFNEKVIENLENMTDLTLLDSYTLTDLYNLVSKYMENELFIKNVPDDEEELCWNLGRYMVDLLLNEAGRRILENKDYDRKRNE